MRQIGIEPDLIKAPAIDETPLKAELPRLCALRLAAAKADALAAPDAYVLGADTIVACGRRQLPKALDEKHARQCLTLLSGRRHQVISAFKVIAPDGRSKTGVSISRVAFKRLSESEIADYLESREWHGKAGGYAIQGRAAGFIRFLEGSYSGVVGLPLFEVAQAFKGLGFWQ